MVDVKCERTVSVASCRCKSRAVGAHFRRPDGRDHDASVTPETDTITVKIHDSGTRRKLCSNDTVALAPFFRTGYSTPSCACSVLARVLSPPLRCWLTSSIEFVRPPRAALPTAVTVPCPHPLLPARLRLDSPRSRTQTAPRLQKCTRTFDVVATRSRRFEAAVGRKGVSRRRALACRRRSFAIHTGI